MSNIKKDDLGRLVYDLKRVGLEPIVIGGEAISRTLACTATKDLDFVVKSVEMGKLNRELRKMEEYKVKIDISPFGDIYTCELQREDKTYKIHFIDQYDFTISGSTNFYGFLEKEGSILYETKYGPIRIAKPEVVIYTRLTINEWKQYIAKTVRDAKRIAKRNKRFDLNKVLEVAKVLGHDLKPIKERIAYLKERLKEENIE